MDHTFVGLTRHTPFDHQVLAPLQKIVETVVQSGTDMAASGLDETGSGHDRVEIISAEEIKGHGEVPGGAEIRRLQVWLHVRLEDDPDELGQARQELVAGPALIQVRAKRNEEQVRVHAILSQDGDDPTHYYGRWTITPSDSR